MKSKVELRKSVKSKKPRFLRRKAGMKKRVGMKWRKPKGSDNKMKWKVKGKSAIVKPGYKGPLEAKGLHKSGLIEVMVCSVKDLKNVDPKKHAIIISGKVGERKKIEILKNVKDIKVLGIKNVDQYIKNIEEKVKKRKASLQEEKKAKEDKKKEMEKLAKEKEKKEEKEKGKEEDLAEKLEKEEKDKKEKDKLLIKNQ